MDAMKARADVVRLSWLGKACGKACTQDDGQGRQFIAVDLEEMESMTAAYLPKQAITRASAQNSSTTTYYVCLYVCMYVRSYAARILLYVVCGAYYAHLYLCAQYVCMHTCHV